MFARWRQQHKNGRLTLGRVSVSILGQSFHYVTLVTRLNELRWSSYHDMTASIRCMLNVADIKQSSISKETSDGLLHGRRTVYIDPVTGTTICTLSLSLSLSSLRGAAWPVALYPRIQSSLRATYVARLLSSTPNKQAHALLPSRLFLRAAAAPQPFSAVVVAFNLIGRPARLQSCCTFLWPSVCWQR